MKYVRFRWWTNKNDDDRLFLVRFEQKASGHFEMRIDARIHNISPVFNNRSETVHFHPIALNRWNNSGFCMRICFFFPFFSVTSNMRSTMHTHCTLWKSIISRNFASKKKSRERWREQETENLAKKIIRQKKSKRRMTKKAVDLVELEQLILFSPLFFGRHYAISFFCISGFTSIVCI